MIFAFSTNHKPRDILDKILEFGVAMITHIKIWMSVVDGLSKFGHIHLVVRLLDNADDLLLQFVLALVLRQFCIHIVSNRFDRHKTLVLQKLGQLTVTIISHVKIWITLHEQIAEFSDTDTLAILFSIRQDFF